MKKCPKCNAEIQENARFCLYCMTSFEQKQALDFPKPNNRRWLILLAAVSAVALILAGVLLFGGKKTPAPKQEGGSTVQPSESGAQTLPQEPDSSAPNGEQVAPQTDGTSFGGVNGGTQNGGGSGVSSQPAVNNTPASGGQTSSQTGGGNTNGGASNSTPVSKPENQPESNPEPEPEPETPPTSQAKYTYIAATVQNTYPDNRMASLEGCIVITKVNYKESSGNYTIPQTVDGQTVVAIMPNAFSGTDARSVTLPATVKSVWSNAFAGCGNLTDLYFRSRAIHLEKDAFPAACKGKITIHCARDCRDFDYYYYKNTASNYGATYKEWNG
jgi:hypothetical protein